MSASTYEYSDEWLRLRGQQAEKMIAPLRALLPGCFDATYAVERALYAGTPKTDPDYEHSEAALRERELISAPNEPA